MEEKIILIPDEVKLIENNENDENEKAEKPDLFLYTKRNDFTSEIFKIEINNLPGHTGHGELKKLLSFKMKLKPHKIKLCLADGQNSQFVFVNFRCEEDRDKALESINGFEWKGRTLSAKKASPIADPMTKMRQEGLSEDVPFAKKMKLNETEASDIPISIRVKNAVTPLWEVPYEEQLEQKQQGMKKFLIQLGRIIEKTNSQAFKWMKHQRKNQEGMCCPLDEMKPSPVITGYRNKCEFNIGLHLETQEKTVGFRISSYKQGSMSVGDPSGCINVSEKMIQAAHSFQDYICQSDKEVFNPEVHSGYWRQLTVRTSLKDDLMLGVVIHPQSLSQEEMEIEKIKLAEYFETGEGKRCQVTSLYFQTLANRSNDLVPFQHVWGSKYLDETLLDMNFKISPEAFFQVNTLATEVLYRTVGELAGVDSETIVLDLCCGTGTIGLTLAKKVLKVVGVELCQAAVHNARENAERNGIKNVDFINGKVEDYIFSVIHNLTGSENVVAIVDPPRAGLHNKVIKAIRGSNKLKRLVYLSCSPNNALTNFTDLCRSTSNNYRGEAFLPTRAVAVDMFPQTPHCELVILFERKEIK